MIHWSHMRPKKGFTLIEIVVVVGIIGLLAALTVLSLSRTQAKARDTKRVADLTAINTAVTAYITDHYEPPKVADYTAADINGWDYSSESGGTFVDGGDTTFMKFLADGNYLPSVPLDPINNGTGDVHSASTGKGYAYSYFYHYAGVPAWNSWYINGSTSYALGAKLETGASGGNSAGVVNSYNLYYLNQAVRPQ